MGRQTIRLFVVALTIALLPLPTSAADQATGDELAAALASYPALGDIALPTLDEEERQGLLDGVPVGSDVTTGAPLPAGIAVSR